MANITSERNGEKTSLHIPSPVLVGGEGQRTKVEDEEVVIPITTCQMIQRFFHICTEQHLVLQDLYLIKIN